MSQPLHSLLPLFKANDAFQEMWSAREAPPLEQIYRLTQILDEAADALVAGDMMTPQRGATINAIRSGLEMIQKKICEEGGVNAPSAHYDSQSDSQESVCLPPEDLKPYTEEDVKPEPKKSPSNNANGSTVEDELDSFGDQRRTAIEATIVKDKTVLPRLCDIAGLEKAKEALTEALLDPLIYPDYFHESDLTPWKCVLLYGPPGTGKSALSQAIAREIDSPFYQVSSSDLISSWSGQSEKLIRSLFDHALKQTRAVVFIDEVDSLCRQRSASEDDGNRRVKTELLLQLQRLHSSSNLVLLVCATNCPWELDPAFLRRFEKQIFVELPDVLSRQFLLQKRLYKTTLSDDVSIEWISDQTHGFSGDDLLKLAREIAFVQFRQYKEYHNKTFDTSLDQSGELSRPTAVTRDQIIEVLRKVPKSVSTELMSRFADYSHSRP